MHMNTLYKAAVGIALVGAILIPQLGYAYGGGGVVGLGFFGVPNVTPATTPAATPVGEVKGATTCELYLKTFIRQGKKNDVEEVKKLQVFLNKELGASLTVNGIYDAATVSKVNEFQVKYSDQILRPWLAHGLFSDKQPTGYVYKTTQRMINILSCPGSELPMPKLP